MRDPLERMNLARALIAAQCSVTMINAADDASDLEETEEIEVIVADFDAPNVFAIVEALRREHAELPTVAWTSRKAVVERGLTAMGFVNVIALERTARIPDLVEAVQRLAGT